MMRDHFYFMIEEGAAKGENEPYPVVDLLLTAEEVCLLAEVPGIPRKALQVKVYEDHVELRGRKLEPEFFSKATHFYKLESFYGVFERHVPLPVRVEVANARIELADGILKVRIPRHRPKIIEIPIK